MPEAVRPAGMMTVNLMGRALSRINGRLRGALSERSYARLLAAASTLNPSGPRLSLEPWGEQWRVHVDGRALHLTSAKRASLYFRGYEHRLLYLRSRYSFPPHVTVEAGDVVCDLGANVGEFALSVSEQASRIVCVEPDPCALRCLRANLRILDNVEIWETLLWKTEEALVLNLASDTADSSVFGRARQATIGLKARRLDDVLAHHEQLDFIKLDAEGAEPEVLEGAPTVLARCRKIAIDCGPERDGQPTDSAIVAILNASGFRVRQTPEGVVTGWRQP